MNPPGGWRFLWPALLLTLVLGCGGSGDTRFSSAVTKRGPAVAKEAVPGDKLNAFFPKPEVDWGVVYTMEKQGQSQAELKKSGKAVAQMSIFDTLSNPDAAKDFADVKDMFADKYPLVAKGKLGTAILVGDRFLVQVRSLPGADFSEDDRKSWLLKFNLNGLERLQ